VPLGLLIKETWIWIISTAPWIYRNTI